MDFFWGNIFEYFKDRRGAALFYATLLVLFIALIVGAILYHVICAYHLQDKLLYFLPGGALILMAWIGSGIARARARRRNRYKSSPLSRDELIKARSKLTRIKH
jgi:hypothetical protein